MVGEGPDFLIALGDHPLMPPHNAFAHVVDDDLRRLKSWMDIPRRDEDKSWDCQRLSGYRFRTNWVHVPYKFGTGDKLEKTPPPLS